MSRHYVKTNLDILNESSHNHNHMNNGNFMTDEIPVENNFLYEDPAPPMFHESSSPYQDHFFRMNSPSTEESILSPEIDLHKEDSLSDRVYNFHIHRSMDIDDESTESNGSKKRKMYGVSMKSPSKKSILEDLREILEDGNLGVTWVSIHDSEGDEQDGIHIYNDELLESILQERRNVKSYGLSKHLAKDLRYYGFMYDKERKIFWNEDYKNEDNRKSLWQRYDAPLTAQLKRITSEAERNMSRLLSLVKNVELAETLKNPDIANKLCPAPSKYINLNEISLIMKDVNSKDVFNITLLLHNKGYNQVISKQMKKGWILVSDFDQLLTRMGSTLSNFIENLRDFVKGAKYWYHGFMESDEATELLKDRPVGSYLIRESTRSDCYSLSWTCHDEFQRLKVNHMRISYTSSGYKVISDAEPSRTLPLWVQKHSEYLKYPLPNQIYNRLVVQNDPPKTVFFEERRLPKDYVIGFPGL